MKPPIIAIEGASVSGVSAQVDKLEASLIRQGLKVGIIKFPELKNASSYFIKEYQSGTYGNNVNPYASSVFYALERFDAQNQIQKLLGTKDVLIICNYTGHTMAKQGARFDQHQQKAFCIWLDGFESQFFGNIRPSHSFVLNYLDTKPTKLGQTYQLLCQYFPKDYSLVNLVDQNDNALVASIEKVLLKTSDKPAVASKKTAPEAKKAKRNTASVLDILRSQDDVADIKFSKEYYDIAGLNQHQLQIYQAGTQQLNEIRNKIIKDTPDDKKNYSTEFLSILSTVVSYTGNKVKKTSSSSGSFENVLHDNVKLAYSSGIKTGAVIAEVLPRNQMTVVNDILFAVTDLSLAQIQEQANKISYEKKAEIIRSYIKDGHSTGLNNVSYTFNIGTTLHNIMWLKRYLQKETITIQDPSPRNGYDVPKWAAKQSRLYEDYFDSLINLNSQLSNTPASRYLVALGNISSAKIKLSYYEVIKLKQAKNAPQIAHDIVMAAAVTHPILYE